MGTSRLQVACAAVLSAPWLVAAILKVSDPGLHLFQDEAGVAGLAPWAAACLYWSVAAAQLLVAVGLVLSGTRRKAFWASLVLSGSLLVGEAYFAGGTESCGCFGASLELTEHLRWALLIMMTAIAHVGIRVSHNGAMRHDLALPKARAHRGGSVPR